MVIPAYNEAARLPPYLTDVVGYLDGRDEPYEVLVVDDGSKDATADCVRALSRTHPSVGLVRLPENRGKGYAVRTGMLKATGRYRLFADAGLCVPYAEIEKGLALLESGADVAIGSRKLAESQIVEQQAGYRRIGSAVFGFLVRNWMGLRYSDTQCGFKLFTAEAAERLFSAARIDGFMFDAETLINARKFGLTVREFPVEWRADPDSRYKPFSGSFRNLFELVRIQLQ